MFFLFQRTIVIIETVTITETAATLTAMAIVGGTKTLLTTSDSDIIEECEDSTEDDWI